MIKCLLGHSWRFDWYMDEDKPDRRNELTCKRCGKLKSRFWGDKAWQVRAWLDDHLSKRKLERITKQIEADYGRS